MTRTFYQILAFVLAIPLAVTLTAVYISRRQPNNLSERCVQALASLTKSTDATVTSSGDRIWIGSKEVRVTARIENEQPVDNPKGFLVGLRVDILLNGARQPFTLGSVGAADNRDHALKVAIYEWSQYVGRALLDPGRQTGADNPSAT